MPSEDRVRRLIERLPSTSAVRLWRAPGRVNIIGEHVDYLGGCVLPFACDLDVLLACVPDPDAVVLDSLDEPGTVRVSLDGAAGPGSGWGRYPLGVVRALREAGASVAGVRGVLHSTVPVGAGLSSSAAVEAAVALAVTGGVVPEPEILQRAEHLATGVPCGIMDQVAVLGGRRDHVILLDCATGATQLLRLPEHLGFVIIDTGTRRALSDGRYAVRRTEAEEAVRSALRHTGAPDVGALGPSDVTVLGSVLPEALLRRLRHVIGELDRVRSAVTALRTGDLVTLGRVVDECHVSLRDDFEVSSPALDAAVEAAREHPACLGARLVGAGFAGCVLALVGAGTEPEVVGAVSARLPQARAFTVRAADGAGALSGPGTAPRTGS